MSVTAAGIQIIHPGTKSYGEILQIQEELFNANVTAKLDNKTTANYLILCEHQPVFTLGKSGRRENILVSDEDLQAEYHHISRGGDVTYHGPGQLTAYPILDLDTLHIGVAKYIYNLEETIIRSLIPYGLTGERIENAAGIWLRHNGPERKIGAIGAHASRNITMHGVAINVNTDLSWFDKIISCGIRDKGVTSLQKELGKEIDFGAYKQEFTRCFLEVFGFNSAN
jgi:lipoyl(octanoyl) transferase